MYNFTPGITTPQVTNQIAPASNQGDLLNMLHQLIQRKLGVTSIGENRYPVAPGGTGYGMLDRFGDYHPGNTI